MKATYLSSALEAAQRIETRFFWVFQILLGFCWDTRVRPLTTSGKNCV
jgi:hypothetical protein